MYDQLFHLTVEEMIRHYSIVRIFDDIMGSQIEARKADLKFDQGKLLTLGLSVR